ncbi:MAG: FKBP-type peptidyl-prolyl cis-trans isomerase [Bacteroidetes bacterium]|nr:FKBP-type peptidyl-prolyl cis-trans isomerase [Bacteroidota bacterium]
MKAHPKSFPQGRTLSKLFLFSFPLGRMGWAFCFLLSSCGNSRFPGYSETENELLYKIQDIGDGERKAKPDDYVTAQIIIKTEKDSVLYDTRNMGPDGAVTFILPVPEHEKDYREGFQFLSEGDSATFVTDIYSVYIKHDKVPSGMTPSSIVKVETRVLKIQTKEEHEKEMLAEQKKLEMGEFDEKKILEKYIADTPHLVGTSPVANGMYYVILREGKGFSPDSGRVALINYKGCFLNGRCFDSNYESQPFEYIIGAEEQLIKGLEIGVKKMREGEKAKFIIPSHLAFGSSGSSTGIIPPFTTVIYEVELLKVQ